MLDRGRSECNARVQYEMMQKLVSFLDSHFEIMQITDDYFHIFRLKLQHYIIYVIMEFYLPVKVFIYRFEKFRNGLDTKFVVEYIKILD